MKSLSERTATAVAHYWQTRAAQREKQVKTGKADQGLRSAVTGGAQMDGFIDLFTDLITQVGIPARFVFRKKAVELPGFFRPSKEWDLLVVRDRTLIAAIEAKSQVGPSFSGRPSASAPILTVLNLFWAISSCWRTARHRTARSMSGNLTSKSFLSSLVLHTCAGMNCSAENSFWSVTIPLQPSSPHPATKACMVCSRPLQMICR
jgi:hypothetical protein